MTTKLDYRGIQTCAHGECVLFGSLSPIEPTRIGNFPTICHPFCVFGVVENVDYYIFFRVAKEFVGLRKVVVFVLASLMYLSTFKIINE